MDWLMAHTACLVCLVSIVSGHSKNALGRGSSSNGHITKFDQSTFLSISMVCGEFIFLQIFVAILDKLLLFTLKWRSQCKNNEKYRLCVG
jgi:hypothetical protein